jgi:hypothetical protein
MGFTKGLTTVFSMRQGHRVTASPPLLSSPLDPVPRDVAQRIRGWVRAVLDLTDDAPVTVTQLACRAGGCAPVKTVLAVLRPGAPLARTLPLPAAKVCAADVLLAFNDHPGSSA